MEITAVFDKLFMVFTKTFDETVGDGFAAGALA